MAAIHEAIQTHEDEILQLWMQGIKESAFAEGLSQSELSGTMPDYLRSLGRSVLDGPPRLSELQQELIERHLSNRIRQGATLNEILTEFAGLSRIISRFLEHEIVSGRFSTRDAANLLAEIHLACMATIRIFNEHLLEDEQPLKRFIRLLQNLADSPDHIAEDQEMTRRRIAEELSLVTRAMGAEAAALLVVDPSRNRLSVSAAAGAAQEVLEAYVTSLSPAVFAGLITASGNGAAMPREAEFADLAVNDVLRRNGIHALLGVRLSVRHTLQGVMCIGLGEKRTFGPSEIRRVETLADALAVHLDHAQTYLALRARAEEARTEGHLRGLAISMGVRDLHDRLAAARASVEALSGAGIEAREALVARAIREIDRVAELVEGLEGHEQASAHRVQ